jgi:2-polyprenyl-6-methoxyphenol hydroxylase-like FAD-dependent oxidoreductase
VPGAFLFPQGGGRVRAYVSYPAVAPYRIQGEAMFPQFVEESIRTGVPAQSYSEARPVGPLATFNAADTWVEHPYNNGVALIGDAAASSDPTWGQGLSLTLRDVRVLRDHLLATTDWNAAGHNYATEHDRHYGVIHEVMQSLTTMFLVNTPEAQAHRDRAMPLIAQDPTRVPDHVFGGPDLPWSDAVKQRFFADAHETAAG